jgi:hypothetical protein
VAAAATGQIEARSDRAHNWQLAMLSQPQSACSKRTSGRKFRKWNPIVTQRRKFTGDLRQTILSACASIGSDGKGTGGIMDFIAKHDPTLAKRLQDNPELAKSLNPGRGTGAFTRTR